MKLCRNLGIAAIIVLLFSGLVSCGSAYPIAGSSQYNNPAWAPPYYAGVRYYYLPDIETYYDLQNKDFAYMDNGQWMFSASLPAMYSNYNLYKGFSVSLSNSVYQPWMHYQYYTANYPRYYYRDRYQGTQNAGIRGFNENIRQPVFTKPEDRYRFNDIRRNEQRNPTNTVRPSPPTRPAQNPFYRGKNIGQPVKVRPYMRQSREINSNKNAGTREVEGNERPVKKQ